MKTLVTASLATASATAFGLAAALSLGTSTPAWADHPMAAEPVKLTADLTGAAETKGGDMDGQGSFVAMLYPARSLVCYGLAVSGIDTPTMAHIHTAAAGTDGGVAVALDAPASGSSSGCAEVPAEAVRAMLDAPDHYYVNVHNAAYPAGAVRGQLMK